MECRPRLPKNKMVSSLIKPTSEKSTLNNNKITPLLNNSNLMSALKLRLQMKTYPRHQYPLMIAIIHVLAVVGKRSRGKSLIQLIMTSPFERRKPKAQFLAAAVIHSALTTQIQ